MASLAAQLSLKDQLADAKKLYQEADENDADNTVELFKKYRELKKEVKEAEAAAAASQAAASSEDKPDGGAEPDARTTGTGTQDTSQKQQTHVTLPGCRSWYVTVMIASVVHQEKIE